MTDNPWQWEPDFAPHITDGGQKQGLAGALGPEAGISFTLRLPRDLYQSLDKAAADMGAKSQDAARHVLQDWLIGRGYC